MAVENEEKQEGAEGAAEGEAAAEEKEGEE